MNNTTELKLLHPIELADGSKIEKVQIQNNIKRKHLKEAAKATTDLEIVLLMLPAITGLEDDIVDEMDMDDITRIGDIIKKNRTQRSGANPTK